MPGPVLTHFLRISNQIQPNYVILDSCSLHVLQRETPKVDARILSFNECGTLCIRGIGFNVHIFTGYNCVFCTPRIAIRTPTLSRMITISKFVYVFFNYIFCGKKDYSKDKQEVQNTTFIYHIQNISDFYGFRGVATQ